MDIQNKDDFLSLIKQIEQSKDYKKPKAYGVAILDRGQLDKNKVLQASFAYVNFEQNYGSFAILIKALMNRGLSLNFDESELVAELEEKDIDFIPLKMKQDILILMF